MMENIWVICNFILKMLLQKGNIHHFIQPKRTRSISWWLNQPLSKRCMAKPVKIGKITNPIFGVTIFLVKKMRNHHKNSSENYELLSSYPPLKIHIIPWKIDGLASRFVGANRTLRASDASQGKYAWLDGSETGAPENRPIPCPQKEMDHRPTIHFQVLLLC